MSFSRKTLFVAGAVLLAACGDKVTVAEYVPPPVVAKVNSVEVAPTAATLNIGQSITLTAAVNADAGVATTVTWAASAANVTVSSAGVVAAVSATPGVAVCATSTVDTGKKGCATIVVTPAPVTIPATISIHSITYNGDLIETVDPTNIQGNIDFTLNINPGNQTISKVELLLNGVVAASQSFTAAQAAALRFAADEAVAAQSTFPQVVFMVNTRAYDTTKTPVATYLNGSKTVSARLTTTASTTPTATAGMTLVFNNRDAFDITQGLGAGAISKLDDMGFRWNGHGSVKIRAIPVMYSGLSLGTVTIAFGEWWGCMWNGGDDGPGTLNGKGYDVEFALTDDYSDCGNSNPTSTHIVATSAAGDALDLYNNGWANTQKWILWDNHAPDSYDDDYPNFYQNPNNRTNFWINDAVSFNTIQATANLNGWLQDDSYYDDGIGGTVSFSVKAAAGTTTASAVAGTAMTTASTLAVSATPATYCAVAYMSDLLGNTSHDPAAGACGATEQTIAFGVDRYKPLSVLSANSMAANFAGTALTQARVIATDTGITGNSGFIPGTSIANVTSVITRRTAAATSTTAITAGAGAASNTVANLVRYDGAGALVADTLTYDFSGTTTNAYYTLSSVSTDQAGNASDALVRTFLRDNILPTALVPTQNVVGITAGGPVTFTTNVSDDLDLSTGTFNFGFPAASFSYVKIPAATIAAPPAIYAIAPSAPVIFNTYNVAPAVIAGSLSGTIPAYYALQSMTDSVTVVASNAWLTSINASVTDMAANSFSPAAGAPQNNPVALPALYVIGTSFNKFLLDRSSSTINVTGSTTSGAVFSRTVTPRIEGTTTMAVPFTTLSVYVLANAGTSYLFLGTSTYASQTDNGGLRSWGYTPVTLTSASAGASGGVVTLQVVGFGTAGKAIMGQGVQLTVSP